MILVLFGQPGSGKTTIANELKGMFMSIDGDRFFRIFKKAGEDPIALLNKASDIAVFLDNMGMDCVISLPYQYKEARKHLNSSKSDIYWVYLKNNSKPKLDHFDEPEGENVLEINTAVTSLDKTITLIENYISQ